jgi:rhomboid protease GluP
MDWSLALASQEILSAIHPPRGGLGWALEVDSRDTARALRTLRLYHVENRRWRTPLAPSSANLLFHWGVLLWCLLLVIVASAADAPGSALRTQGVFHTAATARGEWWRPLTATFLHEDPAHLAANATTGFLLLGLAMGRYGVGPALFASLLAGTAGNLLAWAWRGRDYFGLGASGVVMAALGLLTVSLVADVRAGTVARPLLTRSLLGGSFLFILLGTSQHSDVLAHAGGFLVGALAGLLILVLPRRWTEAAGWDVGCAVAYLLAFGFGWVAALR